LKKIYKKIELSVTEEDREFLKLKAREARMSLSKFVIYLAENRPIFVINDLAKFAVQVKMLGTNVNQIAKIANTQKFLDLNTKKVLRETNKKLEEIAKGICKILATVNIYRDRNNEISTDIVEIRECAEKLLMLLKIKEQNGCCKIDKTENQSEQSPI
jgi:ribosomal protein L11